MWWAAMTFGSFIFQSLGFPASVSLPDHIDLAVVWDLIKTEPTRIFMPWLLGGYLLALLSMPLSYMIFYNMVHGAKKARVRARERRLHRIAREVTGQPR